jgi:uncharacterized membrane protein YhaH (DUF805 family)
MFKLFLEAITKKYFKTNIRASRKEYFSFILFSTLLTEIAGFIFIINDQKMNWFIGSLVFISILFTLYSFIPSITLTIRRLHDLNLSGWWCFILTLIGVLVISFIPQNIISTAILCVLIIVAILIIFKKGTPTTNKYGEPPTN